MNKDTELFLENVELRKEVERLKDMIKFLSAGKYHPQKEGVVFNVNGHISTPCVGNQVTATTWQYNNTNQQKWDEALGDLKIPEETL